MIYIDSERCTGCGACIEVCPEGAIWLVKDVNRLYAEIDQSLCRACRACIEVCAEGAIRVETEPVVEGELVSVEPEAVSVKAGARELQPAQPVLKALAWLGPALVFVGREVLPRVAAVLLEAWERRASGPGDQVSTRQPVSSGSGAGGQQHRWRGGWRK
ncbi:MAG: 4Fe-4S dicluster domain-containing protein [Anaerolineae bacterium]|nr:4Fe-4S dicluster domain-containing protein [Anaerolineae bacterium]